MVYLKEGARTRKGGVMDDVRVMIVDDEIEYLETLMKRMKKRNIDVRGASSGEEALSELERQSVDVVILDVKMPGIDGMEVLQRIKSLYPLISVIMLSGHAHVDTAIKGIELGAFDYLMKPTKIEELLFKIQDAYAQKKLEEAGDRASKDDNMPEPEK